MDYLVCHFTLRNIKGLLVILSKR